MDQYIGLDVSLKDTAVSIREDRKRIWRDKCPSDPNALAQIIRKHAPYAKLVVFETGPLTRFLDDGRICMSNNCAERSLRGVALGRKAWLFAGSDRGGQRAAAMYSLIVTAKMNRIDPQAWLADVLARIADHPASRLDELLPWNWRKTTTSPLRQAA